MLLCKKITREIIEEHGGITIPVGETLKTYTEKHKTESWL